jgi:hypothetical protein
VGFLLLSVAACPPRHCARSSGRARSRPVRRPTRPGVRQAQALLELSATAEVGTVSAMVEQRSHYIASDVLANAAALRADLIRTAQRTAQLMCEIALTRDSVAAHYRQMAGDAGPDAAQFLQHAAQLDQAAERARRFAALEYQQVNEWQQRDATAD